MDDNPSHILNEFLANNFSDDILERLERFDEFLKSPDSDTQSPFFLTPYGGGSSDCPNVEWSGSEVKCGEVMVNAYGKLVYKCCICLTHDLSRVEFCNHRSFEEHLAAEHARTCKSTFYNSLPDLTPDDQVFLSEIIGVEKLNYKTHGIEFLREINKALEIDEEYSELYNNNNNSNTDDSNDTSSSMTGSDEDSSSGGGGTNNANTINTSANPSAATTIKSESQANLSAPEASAATPAPATKRKKKRTAGQCEVCQRVFNDLYNLRIHMMIHTGEMPYQCEECGKRFRQYNKLKIHRITHTNKKPFSCEICGKGFRFRNYLSVHRRLHTGDRPYKCKFCDEHFHSLHSRRLHMQTQHSESKTFACSLCDKVLTAQCHLDAHMKRHRNQRDHACDLCDKKFFNVSQLKDHKLSHTNIKPYECEVCGTRFQRKSNYNQHIKIHSNVKMYVCHICKKAFAQNAGLYGHMKSHLKDCT